MKHPEQHIQDAIAAGVKATGGRISESTVAAIVEAAAPHILDAQVPCRAVVVERAVAENKVMAEQEIAKKRGAAAQ